MAKIAELVAEISMNTVRLQADVGKATQIMSRGMKKMSDDVSFLKRSLAGIVSISALTALGKSAIDAGGQLSDASKKFGVAASELSQLQYVAKLSGVEFEDLGGAFKFLSKAIAEAENPTSDAAIAFKAMGISVKDAKGDLKSTDALFMELADAFAGMRDGANKTALAMAIFGRSGANILPVMADGAAGINKLKNESKALAVALSGEQIAKLDQYGDTIDKIGMGMKATAGVLTVDLVEGIKSLWDGVEKYGPAIEAFFVKVFGGELSPGSGGIKQGKISDILVPNPEPGKKKDAPNIEAIKKAQKEQDKAIEEGQKRELKLLGERTEVLASFYGDAAELAKMVAEEDIAGFESRQRAEEAGVARTMKLLADRAEALAGFYGDETELAKMAGDEEIAAFEERQKLRAEIAQPYADLYKTAWLDANLAIADSMASLYSGMQSWISSSLQGLITNTMTAMDVLKNLGKMMLGIVTDYIAKWITSRIMMAAMEKLFVAQQVATTTAAATVIGTAWLEPAYLATVATLGGAAMEGVAALSLGMATAAGLGAAMKTAGTLGGGLSDAINGGTGAMFDVGTDFVPMTMPAIVHKGERILTDEQNRDLTDFLAGKSGSGSQDLTVNLYMDGEAICNVVKKGVRTGRLSLVLA